MIECIRQKRAPPLPAPPTVEGGALLFLASWPLRLVLVVGCIIDKVMSVIRGKLPAPNLMAVNEVTLTMYDIGTLVGVLYATLVLWTEVSAERRARGT